MIVICVKSKPFRNIKAAGCDSCFINHMYVRTYIANIACYCEVTEPFIKLQWRHRKTCNQA